MGGAPVIEWLRPGVGYAPDAAASMRRLEAALGREHDCNSSYRDYDTQRGMFLAWNRYVDSGYDPRYKPNHSRAIDPDKSAHCKGLGDDSDDWTTPGYIALAAEHGWIRTAASDPTERHHFEYQWWNDQHRNDPAPAGREEDDMFTDADRERQERIEKNQEAIIKALGGDLSSENQVSLFQNVSTIRERVEGNLSSPDQVTLFQNVQVIRDAVAPR